VQLDPQLRALLASIRRRIRQYIVADSLLALLALVLVAFWVGLAVDYLPVRLGGTEMPRSARAVLLIAVGVAVVVMTVKLLWGRLQRPIQDDSLALLVERHHPELAGKLVTAVQLTRPNREGDAHEPALLNRVHAEAAAAADSIQSNRIFRWQPLLRKAWLAVPLGIAAIVFALISPQAFGRAAGRLLLLSDSPWPRQAALSMLGVELASISADENDVAPPKLMVFEDQTLRLPQGSSGSLRVTAKADGAIVPDICTVYYRTDDGTRGQANMRRVGRVVDGYQAFVLDGPPLAGLAESVTLSVRGLDSRLDDYRIEAVPPPAITEMKIVSTDPGYLKPVDATAPTSRDSDYQNGLRIREGSNVQLVGKSTIPLGRVDVRLVRSGSATATEQAAISKDGKSFTISIADMREPATITVVPEDKTGISAQLPYRYFLGVVIDDAPSVEMRMAGIGTAVTPIAKIPIRGKATDDYGIDQAKIEIAKVTAPPPDDATIEPKENGVAKLEEPVAGSVATEAITIDRDGNFEVTLDLRAMSEAQRLLLDDPATAPAGAAVNLFAEVSDRYNLKGEHRVKSELYRLEVVTAERLLALLERRELALRARLEQAIDETRGLRDSLDSLKRDATSPPELDESTAQGPATPAPATEPLDAENAASEPASTEDQATRQEQVLRLRAQQNGLQATKTAEELSGIAASLDDLLLEMQNNRVDSVDRSERIGNGVRDPLRAIVAGELAKLRAEITEVETLAPNPTAAAEKTGQAVQTAENVLLQLTAVLEKMLDLESYNEILDMVRELIESQDSLLEETKKEQKRKTLDLFE
jgi:hypothetical protein